MSLQESAPVAGYQFLGHLCRYRLYDTLNPGFGGKTVVFEDGVPQAREVDRLSADIETLCCDWRRMRSVIERITRTPWWDLHTLCCLYCHAPFEISGGECKHEVDCVYERCCQIVNAKPLPLPNQAVLDEWKRQSSPSLSL